MFLQSLEKYVSTYEIAHGFTSAPLLMNIWENSFGTFSVQRRKIITSCYEVFSRRMYEGSLKDGRRAWDSCHLADHNY